MTTINPVAATAATTSQEAKAAEASPRGFRFRDLIDIVNPLHHIPVIGQLYRKVSGDVISPAFQVAGGALFGGPIGAAFAAAGVALRSVVGAEDEAVAAPPAPAVTARGGWMVAQSRELPQNFDPPPEAEHPVATTTPRRGGWMVAAAYAMHDERAANRISASV